MINLFKEVAVLKHEGKLHKKLIFRVRMLLVISLVLGVMVAYNMTKNYVNPSFVLAVAAIGFLLGFYVFSRMNVVDWNEEEEILQTGKMDIVGYVSLALYIASEIGFRTLLKDFYPASGSVLLFAGIFGTLFGRGVGTIATIHRVFQSTHRGE